MDGARFDALSRALAAPSSRRGVMRRLAALATGGVLGGHAVSGAALQVKECKALACSDRPSYFQNRFQTCINNGNSCEYCERWTNCDGVMDTGTTCGTVDANPCDKVRECRVCNEKKAYWQQLFEECIEAREPFPPQGKPETCDFCRTTMACKGFVPTGKYCHGQYNKTCTPWRK